MNRSIDVVAHEALTPSDLSELRALFDSEYLAAFGEWDPELPYGYAPHDVHVVARDGGRVVGHVGWARRTITVGGEAVEIAGVGGVLLRDEARGTHLGAELMDRAARSMQECAGIQFGYLGCREEVVGFYASCGWMRLEASERSIGRDGAPVLDPPGPPILILPVAASIDEWPDGDIDLRGRPW